MESALLIPMCLAVVAVSSWDIEDVAHTIGATVLVHGQGGDQYVLGHSSALFVVDPGGHVAAVLTGPFTAAMLQRNFQALIAGA